MRRTLAEIPAGRSAVVYALSAEGGLRRRLLDLGFTPGASLTCLFAAPFRDPRAYRVRDTIIALRDDDAREILLRETV